MINQFSREHFFRDDTESYPESRRDARLRHLIRGGVARFHLYIVRLIFAMAYSVHILLKFLLRLQVFIGLPGHCLISWE